MCCHCVVCVPLHAGLDRVIVAVIDTGVELASSGVGAAVWANAAEVAGDGVDNDGNGAHASAVLLFHWSRLDECQSARTRTQSRGVHVQQNRLLKPQQLFVVVHHPHLQRSSST
jgi:hypothetical protein